MVKEKTGEFPPGTNSGPVDPEVRRRAKAALRKKEREEPTSGLLSPDERVPEPNEPG